jgi:hypothetical protein
MNLRDKILQCNDIATEQVYVPQWDVTLEVRGLTGRQRGILLQETIDPRGQMDMQKLHPKLVIMSTYDPETGERVFQDGDFDAISEKSGGALEIIAKVATRLSGLNPRQAEKNSKSTQSEDSTSS